MKQEAEIVIQEAPPGAAPGLGFGDFLRYGPAIASFIAGLIQTGKISFVVRLLGKARRVTIEDERT
jgi:hypothetical protein